MQSGRWIYRVLTVVIAFQMGTAGAQQLSNQSADDMELEQRIVSLQSKTPFNVQPPASEKVSLKNLQKFWALNQAQNKTCSDSRKVMFAEKYALTYDVNGQPCRIYDLSFPNLGMLAAKKQLLQLPIRKLTSRDYLDALDQNWGAIQKRNRDYAIHFNPRLASQNSFIHKLKFKTNRVRVGFSGIPTQFTLADLELKAPFALNDSLKADFKNLVQRLEGQGQNSLYQRLAEKPEILLEAVKFEWNDFDKIYNVVLDGRFLPFFGPVEVLNFQEQYRAPVEQITRQILGQVLSQLARLIPDPRVQAIVEVVIDDVFEQIDLLYKYQSLRLESALLSLNTSSLKPLDYQTLNVRATNVLYGQRSDFISSFILAAVQGQDFDWFAIE